MPSLDKCSYVLLCGGSSSPRELITKVGISLKLEASASFLKFTLRARRLGVREQYEESSCSGKLFVSAPSLPNLPFEVTF
jgi:hypothetical protein